MSCIQTYALKRVSFIEKLKQREEYYCSFLNVRRRLKSGNRYKSWMSSKKIIRLKTPSRSKETAKTPDSALGMHSHHSQKTITNLQKPEYSETLKNSLMYEISQLNRIIKLKLENEQQRMNNESFQYERQKLKDKIDRLEKESQHYKEMYELERDNHKRLRKYYETREKQRVFLPSQHQLIRQDYEQRFGRELFNIENDANQPNRQERQIKSRQTNKKLCFAVRNNDKEAIRLKQRTFAGEIQKFKGRSLDNSLSEAKFKCRTNNEQEAYNFTEMSRPHQQESRFFKRGQLQHQNIRKNERLGYMSKTEADEIFDNIIRKTYFKYKDSQLTIENIQNLEDMVKLRKAHSSIRERLAKTIKMLDFQINSEEEHQFMCEYVYSTVFEKFKHFNGDKAYKFLIDKLKECENLAFRSNSELDEGRSALASLIQGNNLEGRHNSKIYNNYYGPILIAEREESNTPQNMVIQPDLELKLNSSIKIAKKVNVRGSQENIRYSIAQIQNLSDLINGETVCGTQQSRYQSKEKTENPKERRR